MDKDRSKKQHGIQITKVNNPYEKNIPAEETEESKNARVPRALSIPYWPQDARTTAHKRTKETVRITMLPKENRLSREEFNTVYKNGVVLRSKNLLIKAIYHSETPRYGVSVSKKIAPTAVTRNKMRRVVYACIQTAQKQKKTKNGSFVLSIHTRLLPPPEVLCDEITTLLS